MGYQGQCAIDLQVSLTHSLYALDFCPSCSSSAWRLPSKADWTRDVCGKRCERKKIYSVTLLSGARKFTPSVFCRQVKNSWNRSHHTPSQRSVWFNTGFLLITLQIYLLNDGRGKHLPGIHCQHVVPVGAHNRLMRGTHPWPAACSGAVCSRRATSRQPGWLGAQVVGHAELRPADSGCINPAWQHLAQPRPTLHRRRAAAAPARGLRGA